VKTQIQIRGRSYTVQGDEKDGDIASIAKYVDAKMRDVASRAPGLDEYTVALMAAMNIASEYERLRAQFGQDLDFMEREVEALAVLAQAGPSGEDAS